MAAIFSPTVCHVNLGAIARNFRRLGDPVVLMPVIKADAYGHGLLPVAGALERAGARNFAVGGVWEGDTLRQAGHRQRILLLLGCQTPDEWLLCSEQDLISLVNDFECLEMAANSGAPLKIAIKCDTGMGRLGFSQEDIPALAEKIRSAPNLTPVMVVSHLASADMPEDAAYTSRQIRAFEDFSRALAAIFPNLIRSLGNSAATLGVPEAAYDALRPGFAIYGGNPFAGTEREALGEKLEWAMSLATPILQVKHIRKGQSVSYGRIFTAPADMRIAIAACGYAQGFSRSLSNRAEMLARGRRVPQIGRICMSMCMLDVTSVPDLKQGDLVWPMGGEPVTHAVTPAEIAGKLETIPYEVLCLMGSLNVRKYSNN